MRLSIATTGHLPFRGRTRKTQKKSNGEHRQHSVNFSTPHIIIRQSHCDIFYTPVTVEGPTVEALVMNWDVSL
jgi:hypothetical protein